MKKSMFLGFILTALFGGLGLFYASTVGGIIMTIAEVIVLVVAILTLGLGMILFPVVHVISLVWALVAVSSHNNRRA